MMIGCELLSNICVTFYDVRILKELYYKENYEFNYVWK